MLTRIIYPIAGSITNAWKSFFTY
ncbi:MAG: hypothetical protein ACLR7D_08475 [Lachnospira eligens]